MLLLQLFLQRNGGLMPSFAEFIQVWLKDVGFSQCHNTDLKYNLHKILTKDWRVKDSFHTRQKSIAQNILANILQNHTHEQTSLTLTLEHENV